VHFRLFTAIVIVLPLIAFDASAKSPATPGEGSPVSAIEQSLVETIARAEPSVVAVARTGANQPTPTERRAADVFGEFREPGTTNPSSSVVASGVIIDRAGLVLTEYLAVREGSDHSIITKEGKTYSAKVRAADPRSGLAVLAIESADASEGAGAAADSGSFPALKIADADSLRKGQFVIAIGNPFAIASDGEPTASWGIITNLARKAPSGTNLNNAAGPGKDYRTTIHHLGTLIQTDAKLGWSTGGGALVNLRGEIVGLTTTASVIAGHEQPAGYAIPMNATIRRAIDTLKQGREVEYGMLGVGFSASPFGPNRERSPLSVSQVYATGPAARAGLRESDVLTHVGDEPVHDVDGVQLAISQYAPGSSTTIGFERSGEPATTRVKLAKLAVAGKAIATVRSDAWRGMRVDYATALEAPALTQAINSGAFDVEGCVLVSDVERDSVAWRAGVRPGMFVSHVAGKRVTTPDEFRAAAQELGEEFDLTFTTMLSPETAEEAND
jgi:S1-C subfamily serine protease